MEKKAEIDLEKFSRILSSLTLPARLSREMPKPERIPEKESKAMVESALRIGALVSKREMDRAFEYHRVQRASLTGAAEDFAKGFEEGGLSEKVAARIWELGEEAEDRIAKIVSEHMAMPFSRGKEEHLAFPALGMGIKKMRSKAPSGKMVDSVGFWRSGWESSVAREMARLEIKKSGRREDPGEEAEIAERSPGIAALREEKVSEELHRAKTNFGKRRYSGALDEEAIWDGGVDLLEANRTVGSAETPLPCAELYGVGEAEAIAEGNGRDEAFHEAKRARRRMIRGIIPALICQALGDEADPLRGAAGMAKGMWIDSIGSGKTWALAGAEARAIWAGAPHLAALRAAEAAKAALDLGAKGLNSDWREREPGEKPFDRAEIEAQERPIANLLSAAESASERVYGKAAKMALERQRAWMAKTGVLEAWDLAPKVESNRPRTSKLLVWLQDNKEASETLLGEDPRSELCKGVARAFGVFGDSPERLWEGVADGLEARGFPREMADLLAEDAPAREWVAQTARDAMPLKGEAKEEVLGFLRFGLAALGDAYGRGAGSESALKVLDMFEKTSVGAAKKQSYFQKRFSYDPVNGRSQDVFADFPPARDIFDADSARALAIQARAKREKFRSFAGSLSRRLEELEANPLPPGEKRDQARSHALRFGISEAQERLRREADQVMASLQNCPLIDWADADFEKQGFSDLAGRIPAGVAAARREALGMGAAGRIAAACVIPFGIASAKDGIDLIAQAKGALKEKGGIADGAWKALLKASEPEVDGIVKDIASWEFLALSERAERESSERRIGKSIRETLGLRAMAYGSMGALGIPREPLEGILQAQEQRPYLGLSMLAPTLKAAAHRDERGAEFFASEIEAKSAKAPFFLKAACERVAKERERMAAESGGAAPEWREAALSWENREWGLVKDWLEKSEEGLWQEMPSKPTWGWIWRAQEAWHVEVLAAQADAGSKAKKGGKIVSWESPMGEAREGEWQAVELSSGAALAEEGTQMRHCVSSYASKCKSGESRIFSVRLSGQRVCTVELAPFRDGKRVGYKEADERCDWRIQQNRGVCNALIEDKAALAFCESLRTTYAKAHAKLLEAKKAAEERKAKEKAISLGLPEEGAVAEPKASATAKP